MLKERCGLLPNLPHVPHDPLPAGNEGVRATYEAIIHVMRLRASDKDGVITPLPISWRWLARMAGLGKNYNKAGKHLQKLLELRLIQSVGKTGTKRNWEVTLWTTTALLRERGEL